MSKAKKAKPELRVRNQGLRKIKVSEIEDAPWNFRTHSSEQAAALDGAIDEIGFYGYPDVYVTAEGKLRLCDGHLRKKRLIERYGKDAEIEVNVTDFDESEAKKATLTKDPIAAMADTDAEMLRELIASVDTDNEAISAMLDSLAESVAILTDEPKSIVEDEVPEPPIDPITKPGDLWVLGEHRLLCGDSTNPDSWDILEVHGSGGMCFTSPPYNLGQSQKLSGNRSASSRGNAYVGHDDNQSKVDWIEAANAVFRIAIDRCDSVVWNVQPLSGNRTELLKWLASCDCLRDIVTWDKGHAQPAMAPGVMDSRFEWLCIFGKGSASRKIPLSSWRGTVQNVYSAPGQRGNEFANVHAATFPAHLPAWGMSTLCNLSKWCIDPYCGSGTTLIAAEQLGRKCYGIEISPIYCDVIVKRWENLTGKKAVLSSESIAV